MKLSRWPSPLRVPLNAVSRPPSSRSTVKTGCTTSRISSARSLSSLSTELTRNGISSLRMSSTATLGDEVSGTSAIFDARRRALQQKRPRLFGDAGKLRRAIALEIVGRGAAVKLDQKISGNVAPARGEHRSRRADQGFRGPGRRRDGECSGPPWSALSFLPIRRSAFADLRRAGPTIRYAGRLPNHL